MRLGVVAALCVGWVCAASATVENYWIGSGDADDPAKWSLGVLPGEEHVVCLNGANNNSLIWNSNMNFKVAGWMQDNTYTRTVSVHTTKGTLYSNLVVTGDAVLNGGRWQHDRGDITERVNNPIGLFLKVEGNLSTGSAFTFDAVGFGWGPTLGPSGNTGKIHGGISHGGRGAGTDKSGELNPNNKCYGSYAYPNTLGSSNDAEVKTPDLGGGGLVNIQVAGVFTHLGRIDVSGIAGSERCSSPGGSILIQAGTLVGTGAIVANAGGQSGARPSGGGGRIAIYTGAPSYAAFTNAFRGSITAHSTRTGSTKATNFAIGAAGTIYVETSENDTVTERVLRLNNNGLTPTASAGDQRRAAHLLTNDVCTLDQLILERNGRLQIDAGATLILPSASAIIGKNATLSFLTLDVKAILTLLDPGQPFNAQEYSLRINGPHTFAATPLILGVGQTLDLTAANSVLTVQTFRFGRNLCNKGTYTVAQLNEWAGEEIATGNAAGKLVVLKSSAELRMFIY